MKVRILAMAGAAGVLAAVTLVVAQPAAETTTALMPDTAPRAVAAIELELDAVEREAARIAAEASRREVPAVLAEREEARRVEQEQARAAAEAKARQEAEAAAEAMAAAAAMGAAEAEAKAAAPAAPSTGRPTNDYGIAGSAYTGPMYNAGSESTRKCIVAKESGGNYGIVSSNGRYHGAYQFSRPTGDATAQRMGRADLVGTPVSQWSRYEQDMAFWTLWNNGAGRGNWPTASGC